MRPKIVAIIQSRMNSSRLPGKSLVDLDGKPMLERVVERVSRSKLLDNIIVATTTNLLDDAIESLCLKKGWDCHRGVEGKVLEQYYDIVAHHKIDAVVRITADCVMIDPGLIDDVIDKFLYYYPDIDYGSNILPRTYPRGLDVEIIKHSVLRREWIRSKDWREHVTLNLRNNYWNYRTCNITNDSNFSYMRWVVDTEEDLLFARNIYSHFGDELWGWEDVIILLRSHKNWIIMDKNG